MSHPLFEIVTTSAGAISIRNKVVNEIMHNPVGPWVEANSLYIDQSELRERVTENIDEEFVIFDVGLGAAANALAALACIRDANRPVRLVSFERDLELLRFALAHADQFDHFKGYEPAIAEILENGIWKTPHITWELRHGNFLELIEIEKQKPHLIFYDPYSPTMNNEMWTTACFKKLMATTRTVAEGGTLLFTYSRATRVRVAMIAAGFFVGSGLATGLKDETTVAATAPQLLKRPLNQKWLETFRRSHLRHPFDCPLEQTAQMEAVVEAYFNA